MSDASAQPIPRTAPAEWHQRLGFSATCRRTADTGEWVAFSGELDFGTVPVADHALRQAQQEAREVLLDLRALTFIDVRGLNMILAAGRRARQNGGRMLVVHGSPCVSRLFELTGVEGTLETTTDPGAAGLPAEHNGASPNGVPQRFRWDVVDEVSRVRVAPAGELDMASTPKLAHAIRVLREAGASHLVIDLRGLTFIDSTGLRLALDLEAETRNDGLRLELLAGPPQVQRIFELTGALDQLPFVTPVSLDARTGE